MASAEENGPKESETTTEALAEDEKYTTRLRDWIQQLRRHGLDDMPKEYAMTTGALAEEDAHKDVNNDNGGIGGG